jgi:hypothetical protein
MNEGSRYFYCISIWFGLKNLRQLFDFTPSVPKYLSCLIFMSTLTIYFIKK